LVLQFLTIGVAPAQVTLITEVAANDASLRNKAHNVIRAKTFFMKYNKKIKFLSIKYTNQLQKCYKNVDYCPLLF
jgi:hypothetical protein